MNLKSAIIHISILFILTFLFKTVTGQGWQFIYMSNPVLGRSIEITTDGGFLATGSNSPGGAVITIKLDSLGNQLWTKPYGGYCIKATFDNAYIIAGIDGIFGEDDCSLRKIDKYGNTLWFKTYDYSFQDEFYSVTQSPDSGFVAVGISAIHEDSTVFILKVDSFGEVVWKKNLNLLGFAYDIIKIGNYYYISGQDISQPALFTAKLDLSGNLILLNRFNITNYGKSLTQSSDTTFIVAGGNTISNFNLSCDTIWSKTYPEDWHIYSIKQTPSQGFILAGSLNQILTPTNMLVKTNAEGNLIWQKLFYTFSNSTLGVDVFESVQVTQDNGYIACGTSSYNNDFLFRVVKTDSSGNNFFSLVPKIMNQRILFYPNPAHDVINVENNKPDQEGLISIISLDGRQILEKIFVGPVEIVDIRSLPNGLYIIRLSLKNQIITNKFIKQ